MRVHFMKEHHTNIDQLRRPTSRDARVLLTLLLSDPVGYDAFYSLEPLWFQLSASARCGTTDEASMHTRVEFPALPTGV